MKRIKGMILGTAVSFVLLAPTISRADSRPDCTTTVYDQGFNRGSYSPLHYWLPSLYTFRAYHRPSAFNDQAEFDMDRTSWRSRRDSRACSPASPVPAPESHAEPTKDSLSTKH
jgi:hypothetical protein